MRNSLLIAAASLLAACTGGETEPANGSANEAAAAAAAPALPTGEEGVRRYAECASTLNAVSNLYNAIASQSSGAEQEEMLQSASARGIAALEFEMRATQLLRDVPNAPVDQVSRVMAERRDALERERERQPFEDFAIWLGREADQCAAIAPTPA